MKNIWHIAFLDLRLMVRDKIFFFWTLVFPLFFILIFGNLYKQDNTPSLSKASLSVVNYDTGQWGNYFVEKIKSPGIALEVLVKEPESFNRLLIIPADFSAKIKEKKAQELVLKKKSGSNMNASAQAEIKIIQAITRLITELILHPDPDTFFQAKKEFRNIVEIQGGFPENTLKKVPTGFDHVIPGTIVQFILMMVLIYGGVVVMTDRQRGVLARIAFSSVSIGQLWGGKFLGRLMMGILQAIILVVAGLLFFNLNLGNWFYSSLTVLFFSMAVASLSILIGSLLNKEDLIVGISVLMANVFAALGGCWWPIEVVPQTFRTIGMASPAYWAMDSFHKVIFFNKGIADIAFNWGILLGLTVVFTLLSIRYFRLKG